MFSSEAKSKSHNLAVQETGAQFYNPVTHQDDQTFSYEIQIQKEYLHRLKTQRQKIQGLYSKYDLLLSQMKKKDSLIQQQDSTMKQMDYKLKDLELNCQELSLIKEENREVMNENMSLKHRLISVENENLELIEQMKLKQCLVSDEKNELDLVNQQLQDKVKLLTGKLTMCQQEMRQCLQAQRKAKQLLKQEYQVRLNEINTELNLMKNQMMKRDEALHMTRLDNQFLQQKLSDQQENYSIYLKELEAKIQKNQKQKKLQIKGLKDTIDQKASHIAALESKLTALKHELEVKELDIEDAKKVIRQEKKIFDDDIFQLKTQMNNEKIYFKEQLMYCQNHIEKLEKKLTESLKREKDLSERIKKFQINDAAKRNLRQIERQQLEKINKILSLQ